MKKNMWMWLCVVFKKDARRGLGRRYRQKSMIINVQISFEIQDNHFLSIIDLQLHENLIRPQTEETFIILQPYFSVETSWNLLMM